MKALIGKYAVPIAIVSALTAVVFFNLWTAAAEDLSKSEAEVKVLESEIGAAVAANTSNLTTIEDLKTKLQGCIDSKAADQAANDAAVARSAARAKTLAAKLARYERKRKQDYESEECRAWADMPVCPERADSLRGLWRPDSGQD